MKQWASWTMVALAGLMLCGCAHRLVTRPDSYAKMAVFPSTGNSFDYQDELSRYPELEGILISAPEFQEEWARYQEQAEDAGMPTPQAAWKVQPGTHVSITVDGEPTLSGTYVVPPTGYIDLPLVRETVFADKTIYQLRQELTEKLRLYLRDPQVRVNATAFDGQNSTGNVRGGGIVIIGSNGRGIVEFSGRETLFQIVGGLGENAEWRKIRVLKRPNEFRDKPRVVICDLWDLVMRADFRQDIPIEPYDVIFVPPKWSIGDQFEKDLQLVLKYLGSIPQTVDGHVNWWQDKLD